MFKTRVILPLVIFPLVIFSIACSSGDSGGSTPTPPSAPFVTAVTPADTSDTALVTTVITAQFSERMAPLTINNPDTSVNPTPNSFIVSDGSGQIHGSVEFFGTYEGHDNVAVFIPNADLDIGGAYSAMITTDATDTTGTPLASAYPWSFSSASAQSVVSTDGTGAVGNSGVVSTSPSDIDGSGEYVVFASTDNLIAGISTNGIAQIYRKNTLTGRVEFVSLGGGGQLANGACANPSISDEGRFVVFISTASNLDPTITNTGGFSHIYFKDMRDGSISLLDVSIINPNQAANGDSTQPDMSGIPITAPQGRHVVFESVAPDLVAGYTNTQSDIYYVNAATGGIELISVGSSGTDANGPSYNPRVSDNGQRIVFESDAPNLVTGDTNSSRDVFLRIRNTTPITSRLSLDSTGTEANGPSSKADISADGQFAVFQSDANNLILSDTNGVTDVFLRDIDTPATSRLSEDANGTEVTGASTLPSISGDGQYVTFESQSTQLVTPDTNGVADIFVRDKDAANTISRLSVDNLGVQGNDPSTNAVISSDGRYVSFTTPWAFDTTDNNGLADIYRAYNAALP